jgi:hypothetical protein
MIDGVFRREKSLVDIRTLYIFESAVMLNMVA